MAQSFKNKRTCFQCLGSSPLQPLQSSQQGIAVLSLNPVLPGTGFHVSCNEDNCSGNIKDRKIQVLNSLQQNFKPKDFLCLQQSSCEKLRAYLKSRNCFLAVGGGFFSVFVLFHWLFFCLFPPLQQRKFYEISIYFSIHPGTASDLSLV